MSAIGFITIALLLLFAAALGTYRHDTERVAADRQRARRIAGAAWPIHTADGVLHSAGMRKVRLDGIEFTVDYMTIKAFGGEPGVLYYGFVERPGDLFKASRCIEVTHLAPSLKPRWMECP